MMEQTKSMKQIKTVLVVDGKYYVADFSAAEDYSFDRRLNRLSYPNGTTEKIKSVMLTQNVWLAKDFSGTDWQVMTSENNEINNLTNEIISFFPGSEIEVRSLTAFNLLFILKLRRNHSFYFSNFFCLNCITGICSGYKFNRKGVISTDLLPNMLYFPSIKI